MKLLILLCCFVTVLCDPVKLDPAIACNPDTRPHVITEFTAVVWSPFYPDDYPANATCEWLFVSDSPNEVVGVSFNDFSLENCIDCTCDYVEFFDGADDSAPFVSRMCGGVSESAASSGNQLLMRFVSDDSQEFAGFQAEATLVEAGCGDGKPLVVRTESGNISTSYYPGNYPGNEDCGWRFEAPEGTRIQLSFTDFNIEDCCQCDYVDVYDGSTANDALFGHWYSDDVPPVITSSGNRLYVEFNSDFSVQRTGFFATYQHV